MNIVYTLTPDLRVKLKEPFGILIEGTANETMSRLKKLLSKEKPLVLISVGDVVSRNLHSFSIHPQISIIDNISLRNQRETPPKEHGEKIVNIKNPSGTITEEAIDAIRISLKRIVHTHIIVDGEEDLLTLISVLYGPRNAFVVYGQPHCGIVVIKVTPQKKS